MSTSVTPTNSNQLLVVGELHYHVMMSMHHVFVCLAWMMSSVVSIAVILVAGVLVLVAVAALVCVVWFRRRKECKRRE